jgi:hypothetical protein
VFQQSFKQVVNNGKLQMAEMMRKTAGYLLHLILEVFQGLPSGSIITWRNPPEGYDFTA